MDQPSLLKLSVSSLMGQSTILHGNLPHTLAVIGSYNHSTDTLSYNPDNNNDTPPTPNGRRVMLKGLFYRFWPLNVWNSVAVKEMNEYILQTPHVAHPTCRWIAQLYLPKISKELNVLRLIITFTPLYRRFEKPRE